MQQTETELEGTGPGPSARRGVPASALAQPAPILAVRPAQAAAMLGISRDLFDREVKHEIRSVRLGRLHLYPVKELEAFLARRSSHPLEETRR